MRTLLILIVAAAASACHRSPEKDAGAGANTSRHVTQKDTTRIALYPEQDAVAIMHALDTAEVQVSAVARDGSQNDDVLRFAAVMIKDHRDIMHLVDSLGVASRENSISQRIRLDADSIAKALSSVAIGLNNTYMEEEVKAHQKALQLLDTAIIPSAQNAQLKTLLTQLRPTIAAHLQRAMQILSQRHKEAEERGEAWVSGFGAETMVRPQPKPQPKPDDGLLGVPVKPETLPTTTGQ